jgi:Protein of unknown function (DUF3500)
MTDSHAHSRTTRRPLRQRLPSPACEPAPKYSEFLQRMHDRGKKSLTDEFWGITADGSVRPGLFALRNTGVSLEPMLRAACDFLARLDARQRQQASFDLASDAWRAWCNVHPFMTRHGVCLRELSAAQRQAALALLASALSSSGFEVARDVMKLNEHAREITGLSAEYSEWYYWLSIFGTPSRSAPWGWQFDGHHLIINCFVLGDQMVLTPQFMGSEPVFAEFGKYAGTEVFRAEESTGLAMMRGLSAEQQAKAVIDKRLPGEVFAAAYNDNLRMPYQGIRYDDLTGPQQDALRDLIGVYLNRARPGHAEIGLDEAFGHLRETYFFVDRSARRSRPVLLPHS